MRSLQGAQFLKPSTSTAAVSPGGAGMLNNMLANLQLSRNTAIVSLSLGRNKPKNLPTFIKEKFPAKYRSRKITLWGLS